MAGYVWRGPRAESRIAEPTTPVAVPLAASEPSMAGGAAANRAKTHCPRGHAYSEYGRIAPKTGWRSCRLCAADQQRARAKRHYMSDDGGAR